MEVEKKVLNYYIKKVKGESRVASKRGLFADHTVDQIEVLKQHGITEGGTYQSPFEREKKIDETTDFYEAKAMAFDIKGKKSIPSIEDTLKKIQEGSPLKGQFNEVAECIKELTDYVNSKSLNLDVSNTALLSLLLEKLSQNKKELWKERIRLATIKIAKAYTNSWFLGLEIDAKSNYVYKKGETVLLLKTAREKVYFSS